MYPDSLRLTVLTLLVGVAAVAATRLPTVQSEAQAAGLAPTQLSLKLGEWQGVDQPVPPDVQQALPSARLLSRRYQCATGAADVTIIAGSDATALHDPHDCLTGEGWQFVTETTRTVEVPVLGSRGTSPAVAVPTGDAGPPPSSAGYPARDTPKTIQIRDVVMTKSGVRARMWYWYEIGPKIYDRTLPARMALYRTRMGRGKRPRAEFVRLIVGGETESVRSTTLLTSLTREIAGRGVAEG